MTNDNTTTVPTTDDTARLEAEVAEASQPFRRLQEQMHRLIVGQQELLDGLIVGDGVDRCTASRIFARWPRPAQLVMVVLLSCSSV